MAYPKISNAEPFSGLFGSVQIVVYNYTSLCIINTRYTDLFILNNPYLFNAQKTLYKIVLVVSTVFVNILNMYQVPW
jgi:hypothetical protein